jgi:hypothetical protein
MPRYYFHLSNKRCVTDIARMAWFSSDRRSASTHKIFGKCPLPCPIESRNSRGRTKLQPGQVMHRALDNYARGVFQPDDVRILAAAFEDAWRSLLASGITFESDRASVAVRASDALTRTTVAVPFGCCASPTQGRLCGETEGTMQNVMNRRWLPAAGGHRSSATLGRRRASAASRLFRSNMPAATFGSITPAASNSSFIRAVALIMP